MAHEHNVKLGEVATIVQNCDREVLEFAYTAGHLAVLSETEVIPHWHIQMYALENDQIHFNNSEGLTEVESEGWTGRQEDEWIQEYLQEEMLYEAEDNFDGLNADDIEPENGRLKTKLIAIFSRLINHLFSATICAKVISRCS